ncbi:hypothetical protein KUTeg_018711 [Tegillarca granosa]|uniref:Uncharacterized protein n=1 Tax=Tegillarca granosa TaxID=220873 RepID=A0ABQ9EEQ4_TEGGR|nr:hypothetical protein KUTeg_018711 [Tegillarca granosa]
MASYNVGVFYDTSVQISESSGFVKDSSFTCVASAMGRFSHVNGLVIDQEEEDKYGLLEIKYPMVLELEDVVEFSKIPTKKQLYNFCLQECDGKTTLKRNHSYFFQIQTQLDEMGLKWCDLVIWSDISSIVIRVYFDIEFWEDLKTKLLILSDKRKERFL